jgi:outer membrane murein-binding lipoprotein Lpp
MRFTTVMTFLALIALTLGACGGEDSGKGSHPAANMSGDELDPNPSSIVPALVDTKGMTVAQLEAKVEEVEAIHDALMEKMDAIRPKGEADVSNKASMAKLMQVTADMKALREQMQAYEAAIDAQER